MKKFFFSIIFLGMTSLAHADNLTLHGEAWYSLIPDKNQYSVSPENDLGHAQCIRKNNDIEQLDHVALDSIDYCYIEGHLGAVFYHTHGKPMEALLFLAQKYGTDNVVSDSPEKIVTVWKTDKIMSSVVYYKLTNQIEIMEADFNLVNKAIKAN